jgi:hypothetical protein
MKNNCKVGDKVRASPGSVTGTVKEVHPDGSVTVSYPVKGRMIQMVRLEYPGTVFKVTQ